MKISIFGLGYVGTVSAGCLAHEGHEVIGVDPVQPKLTLINRGPVADHRSGDRRDHRAEREAGRLRATSDPDQAIRETELSFVCVGTPSQPNGNLDLRYIRRICEQIGAGAQRQNRAAHGRDPQHHSAGHDAQRRDSDSGGVLREEGRQSISASATIRNFCAKARR